MTRVNSRDDAEDVLARCHPAAHSRWLVFGIVTAVASLTILDMTKVNVALPSLAAGLGSGATGLQFVLAGYIVAFALFLVPAGRLGDQRSRRMLMLVGLAIFLVASLLCAAARDEGVLIAARVVQGIAAGILMPQVIGVIQELFSTAERGRAFGYFGATIGVTTAVGPSIGGGLIALGGEAEGWRAIFWMNVPPAALLLVAVIWCVPGRPQRATGRIDLDPVGIALFGLALLGIMLPFLLSGGDTDVPQRWWLLAGGAAAVVGLFFWERLYAIRGRLPIVPLGLFAIASFRNNVIVALSFLGAISAVLVVTITFLQESAGLLPAFAGMVTFGFALAEAVASAVAGRFVARSGRALVLGGMIAILVAVGALMLIGWTVDASAMAWAVAAALMVAGFAAGIILAPNQTLMLSDVDVAHGGVAGSIGQLSQRVGLAVCTAISLALYFGGSRGADAVDDQIRAGYVSGMAVAALFLAPGIAAAAFEIASRRR